MDGRQHATAGMMNERGEGVEDREIWFGTKTIAEILEVAQCTVGKMCNRGIFPNAYQGERGSWQIPLSDVDAYHARFEDTVGAEEAAGLLGYSNRQAIAKHCAQGRLPGAFLEGNRWHIPLEAIEAFQRPLHSRGVTRVENACPRCGMKMDEKERERGECRICTLEQETGKYVLYEAPTLSSSWMHGCNSYG
jgi:hypothetical protein